MAVPRFDTATAPAAVDAEIRAKVTFHGSAEAIALAGAPA
jgi:hypothetical protein